VLAGAGEGLRWLALVRACTQKDSHGRTWEEEKGGGGKRRPRADGKGSGAHKTKSCLGTVGEDVFKET
jgi:hypothetical protein